MGAIRPKKNRSIFWHMCKKHFYIALILLAVLFKEGFPEGALEERDSGIGEFLPSEETSRALWGGPVYRPGILPLRTADGKAGKFLFLFSGQEQLPRKRYIHPFQQLWPLGPGRTDRQFSPGKNQNTLC